MVCRFGGKLKPSKAGFTMIEMITSTALIVMIMTLFVANYHSNNRRIDLTMTAQKLVSDLHAAQNNTLGLAKYGNAIPLGGWGINFNKSNAGQYIVFADLDRPASSEIGESTSAEAGSMEYNSEDEGDVSLGARIVDLPKGIEIINLKTDNGDFDLANVTFLPPDPRTNILDTATTSNILEIDLKDLQGGATSTIRVNFLGLVEIIE